MVEREACDGEELKRWNESRRRNLNLIKDAMADSGGHNQRQFMLVMCGRSRRCVIEAVRRAVRVWLGKIGNGKGGGDAFMGFDDGIVLSKRWQQKRELSDIVGKLVERNAWRRFSWEKGGGRGATGSRPAGFLAWWRKVELGVVGGGSAAMAVGAGGRIASGVRSHLAEPLEPRVGKQAEADPEKRPVTWRAEQPRQKEILTCFLFN